MGVTPTAAYPGLNAATTMMTLKAAVASPVFPVLKDTHVSTIQRTAAIQNGAVPTVQVSVWMKSPSHAVRR